MEHFDVIVVGAGLAGIGAACHLAKRCPDRSFLILEGREVSGGTWDLFRYPGVRSDSDMFTLGYSFRPWLQAKAIADGPSILDYVRETARDHGVDRHIRYRHKVTRASWDSHEARWTAEAEDGASGETVRFTCSFLFMCSGYYSYDEGHQPHFPGQEDFAGPLVYPQFWPEDLDYKSKRVVVIGSGATAVTLVPAMAETAAHVTMLQRSPTYMVARPSEDATANWLRARLPARLAYGLTRWKNVFLQQYFYRLMRRKPEQAKRRLVGLVRQAVGEGHDVETHFTPRYNPWDQRLCLVPDGDFFEALREGRSFIVTGEIERLEPDGIRLRSGETLPADIVVSATGLKLIVAGGVSLRVDGRPVVPGRAMTYKGMCYSDVPNMAFAFGYTNASYTLKADLTSAYVCRLLNHMRRTGTAICVAPRDPAMPEEPPLADFTSGYVERSRHLLPRQGARSPWRLHQNYWRDLLALRFGRLDDGVMQFRKPAPAPIAAAPEAEPKAKAA